MRASVSCCPIARVDRVKAAQELYFLFRPSVHSEPAFQAIGLLETGQVETYEIGGTVRFIDLENSGFHMGPLRGQRSNATQIMLSLGSTVNR